MPRAAASSSAKKKGAKANNQATGNAKASGAAAANDSRYAIAEDADDVLKQCRSLKRSMQQQGHGSGTQTTKTNQTSKSNVASSSKIKTKQTAKGKRKSDGISSGSRSSKAITKHSTSEDILAFVDALPSSRDSDSDSLDDDTDQESSNDMSDSVDNSSSSGDDDEDDDDSYKSDDSNDKKPKAKKMSIAKKKKKRSSAGDNVEEEDNDNNNVLALTTSGKKMRVEDLKDFDSSQILEVKEMLPLEVIEGIEREAIRVAQSILSGKSFSYQIPSRSNTNQIYIKQLDRIVLGSKSSSRSFLNVKEVRKTAITTRVMQLLHQILCANIHITKRDLFYTDVKLFKDQSESDGVLDDVATLVGCTRSNLHVVASDKGLVVGRIQFVEDGDYIDCTKMGVGGKAIPPYIDKITDITSDAEFILLVEKEAAYMRFAEDRFYHKYPCIIITAKGQPDVATRMFLSRLKTQLQIPVLGLVDSDPYGLKILSVYMSGSKNMSYDSASLTTPDIKWLGLRPSDLDKYNLPDQCRLPMTDADIKTGKEMLKEDFIIKNPKWLKELEIMVKTKTKAEIQALSSFGFQYITKEYMPRKLREGDWI